MQTSFPAVVISGTGLYQPPHVITNAELVAAFNAYADQQNFVRGRSGAIPGNEGTAWQPGGSCPDWLSRETS